MHKTDAANNVANEFSDGTPPLTPGTSLGAKWHNTIQRELVAVVEGAGLVLSDADDGQVFAALEGRYGGLAATNTWTGTTNTFSGLAETTIGLTATQTDSDAPAITATGGPGDSDGILSTGTGVGAGFYGTGGATGPGGSFHGGATSGAGLVAIASAGNSIGAQVTGSGNAAGVQATGGATGVGVEAAGGASGAIGLVATGTSGNSGAALTGNGAGYGVVATGGSSGPGVLAQNGTAATAATRKVAMALGNGDLSMVAVTNPNSNVAVSNTLTPLNIGKVWATVTTDGAGGASILDGFNITSAAVVTGGATTVVRLTFASAFANTDYAPVITGVRVGTVGYLYTVAAQTATTVDINGTDLNATTIPLNTEAVKFFVHIDGRQ